MGALPPIPAVTGPSRKSGRAFPTIWQAILTLLFFVILTILLYVPVGIAAAILRTEIPHYIAAGTFLEIIAAAAVVFWGFRRTGSRFDEVFPLKRFNPSLLLPMACSIAGSSILLSDIDNLLSSALPPPDWFHEALTDLLATPLDAVITLIIVAPLVEETMCRGLILHGFLKNYSRKKAVTVSALLFAVLHLNPWQFTGAFVYGILFAYLYIRTNSLLICYTGHAMANSIPVMIRYVINVDIPGFTALPAGGVLSQPWWFDFSGLALAGIGLWWLLNLLRKESQRALGKERPPAS